MKYHTYQQLPPGQEGDVWVPVMRRRDDVTASSEEAAIAIAKGLEVFRRATGLARFPIVQEA